MGPGLIFTIWGGMGRAKWVGLLASLILLTPHSKDRVLTQIVSLYTLIDRVIIHILSLLSLHTLKIEFGPR
jgi:hypothetical protein